MESLRIKWNTLNNTNVERSKTTSQYSAFSPCLLKVFVNLPNRTCCSWVKDCGVDIPALLFCSLKIPRCIQGHVKVMHVIIHPKMKNLGQELVLRVTRGKQSCLIIFILFPSAFMMTENDKNKKKGSKSKCQPRES